MAKVKTMGGARPVPVVNTNINSSTWTLSASTNTNYADPCLLSPRIINVNHTGYTVTINNSGVAHTTIPWEVNIGADKGITFSSGDAMTAVKRTLSGAFTAAANTSMLTLGNGYWATSDPSGFTGIVSIVGVVSIGIGFLAPGATIKWNGGTLHWATGNTTDYSDAAYIKDTTANPSMKFDPNGQTITLATPWAAGNRTHAFGQVTSTVDYAGMGRIIKTDNETGTGAWLVYPGCVLEYNGTSAVVAPSCLVQASTSASKFAGLEGTGTMASQSWSVTNAVHSYIAGGTTGTNGVLTMNNLAFGGINAELHVYSDGTTNNCSKPHANGTCALGNHKIRLMDPMAAGTYTILSSTGTMSGTAPTSASVIENLSGRTVVSVTQVGNTLEMVLS